MSEGNNGPEIKFGEPTEKGPKSGKIDRPQGRKDHKPIAAKQAEPRTQGSLNREAQQNFKDAYTAKIEITDLLDSVANNENLPDPNAVATGSPIPITEGAYIYTKDPEDPEKLNLVGINTKFANAKSVQQYEDPYAEDKLEVESTLYNQNQSVRGRVRFIVKPNGNGKLKSADE